MKFKCISSETNRIGETNVYQMVCYDVEAETEEGAFVIADAAVKPGYRIIALIQDEYGPNWVPPEDL